MGDNVINLGGRKLPLPTASSISLDPVSATFECREVYENSEFIHTETLMKLLVCASRISSNLERDPVAWRIFVKKMNSQKFKLRKIRRDKDLDRITAIVCRIVFMSTHKYDRSYKMHRVIEYYNLLKYSNDNMVEEINAIGGIDAAYKMICKKLPYRGKSLNEKATARQRLSRGEYPLYPDLSNGIDYLAALDASDDEDHEIAPNRHPVSKQKPCPLVTQKTEHPPSTIILEIETTIEELKELKAPPSGREIVLKILRKSTDNQGWVRFETCKNR